TFLVCQICHVNDMKEIEDRTCHFQGLSNFLIWHAIFTIDLPGTLIEMGNKITFISFSFAPRYAILGISPLCISLLLSCCYCNLIVIFESHFTMGFLSQLLYHHRISVILCLQTPYTSLVVRVTTIYITQAIERIRYKQ
ncbi:hypothetical protein ACJX0J_025605, partial [Zea mays]